MKGIKHYYKILVFLLFLIFLLIGCGKEVKESMSQNAKEYMVLIGENPDIVKTVSDVDVLVIDASYFTKEEIEALKNNNINKIYSYLNIGSIETFRDYYIYFEKYTLDDYENWPDEKWIDVSKHEWQECIFNESEKLVEKGVDGFFIDNVDIYSKYPDESTYDGLVKILSKIKTFDKSVIINGGDSFISKYLESNNKDNIFDGVNQESVYTAYDFQKNICVENNKDNVQYFTNYLEMLLEEGYLVYLIEYSSDSGITEKVYTYSKEHNFVCYVSDNIQLKINHN